MPYQKVDQALYGAQQSLQKVTWKRQAQYSLFRFLTMVPMRVTAGFACMESPRRPLYHTAACPLWDAEKDAWANEIAADDKRKVTKSYLTLTSIADDVFSPKWTIPSLNVTEQYFQ